MVKLRRVETGLRLVGRWNEQNEYNGLKQRMGQFLYMTRLHVIMLIVIYNDGTFNITWASQYLANQVYERTIMLTHKQQQRCTICKGQTLWRMAAAINM